jgi:hypothetical protein
MESFFNKSTAVLFYRPRAHYRRVPREERHYLLWPAFAYRIVAPPLSVRGLNILQKVVLGLICTGLLEYRLIAARLFLHPELIRYIAEELASRGYIDRYGSITAVGKEALKNDLVEAGPPEVGWIFQDPWKSTVWPRFETALAYLELSYQENSFPRLLLPSGTTGDPWRQRAFMLEPHVPLAPRLPTEDEVVTALQRHHRQSKYSEEATPEEGDGTELEMETILADRVAFVTEQPEPVYLATYLYLPQAAHDSFNWYVCDPFGFGASDALRKQIMELTEQGLPSLNMFMKRMLGADQNERTLEIQQQIRKRRELAERALIERFTVEVLKLPFSANLLALESAIIAAEHDNSLEARNAIWTSARQCLEAFLGSLLKPDLKSTLWRRLYPKDGYKPLPDADVQLRLKVAIQELGFADCSTAQLAKSNARAIRAVFIRQNFSKLHSCVMALVLAASGDKRHKLRGLSAQLPNFLNDLLDVIDACHSQVHYQSGAEGPSNGAPGEVGRDLANKIYAFISAIALNHSQSDGVAPNV